MDAVVAHIPHAAQDHAVREMLGALAVSRSQLAENRQQRVADQRVDLVDEQHQRLRVGLPPVRQHSPERTARPGSLQDAGPEACQRLVAQRRARRDLQLVENGPHGLPHVFTRRLAGLDVHVHATEVTLGAAVQQVPQRQERGGLAGLPRRVQHEILLVADEGADLAEVQPFQRRDAVVVVRDDRPRGSEEAHDRQYPTAGAEVRR